METKKTVLLLCPHLINKSGLIWQLLHITKEKNIPNYKTEPIVIGAVKKYFSRLPEGLYITLNKFSEKSIEEARHEIAAAINKIDPDKSSNNSIRISFERWLHQNFTALKHLLPAVHCYHQTASPLDANRFKTAPCSFSNYTPALRFQVSKATDGYLYIETEIGLNDSFYPLQTFTQTGFLLEHRNEYFILRYNDYRTICWLKQLDWKKEVSTLKHTITTICLIFTNPCKSMLWMN